MNRKNLISSADHDLLFLRIHLRNRRNYHCAKKAFSPFGLEDSPWMALGRLPVRVAALIQLPTKIEILFATNG
jgi:hypothetical protein